MVLAEGVVASGRTGARVQVWWLRLGCLPWQELVPVLDDTERDRLVRVQHPQDRERLALGAATLRAALAQRCGGAAQQVRLDRTCPDCPRPHGPPRPQGRYGRLAVSVAHAGELVGVAVADLPGIGLDVEPLREPERLSWLAEVVGPAVAARRHPSAVGDEAGSRGLLTTWTRLEALLKLTGLGLRLSPADLVVTAPDEPPALVTWPVAVAPHRVRLTDLRPDPAHVAALALLDAPADLAVSVADGRSVLAEAGLIDHQEGQPLLRPAGDWTR